MSVRILQGDCRSILATLPDESVHCVVTSPPYWGLRDYGTAQWSGGDPACNHMNGRPGSDRADGKVQMVSHRNRDGAGAFSGDCQKCGAVRVDHQIGLEDSFADYVETMRSVFAEVRRVLRKDGTIWLNLGDCYAGGGRGGGNGHDKQATNVGSRLDGLPLASFGGVKAKDLLGIPWRVAFALQADGWYLRSDIIWSKPNPMPESVTDRPTKAHEYIFLLSKSGRYFYDQEAIREEPSGRTDPITSFGSPKERQDNGRSFALDGLIGRNCRSVWEIATAPFSEAHFATFPPALIEPCILAGCPKQCCAKCGAPWVREVERTKYEPPDGNNRFVDASRGDKTRKLSGSDYNKQVRVIGETYSPSCSCSAGTVPGTVLDPFGGAGTTGMVADRLGRNAILIELNPEYADMAERRIRGDAGMFAQLLRDAESMAGQTETDPPAIEQIGAMDGMCS